MSAPFSPKRTGLPYRKQHGMTLVELMVAMVLGLVLALAALTSTMATSQMVRMMRSTASTNDTGQTVISYLSQQLRAAGYVDLFGLDTAWNVTDSTITDLLAQSTPSLPGLLTLHGCDQSYASRSTLLNYGCTDSQSTAGPLASSLTVAYQVLSTPQGWPAFSLAQTFSNNQALLGDCGGRSTNGTDASPASNVAINRFYLENNRLMCIGSSNPNVPIQIATDVEQFQVLYGTININGNPTTQYVNAATVQSSGLWANVVAVQFCVLIAGEPSSSPTDATAVNSVVNRDCNDKATDTSQGRLRRAQRSTVSLRLHE